MELSKRRMYGQSKRNTYRRRYDESAGFSDTIITQGIVAGMILAFLLFVICIDMPVTRNIRQSLKTALSQRISTVELSTAVDGAKRYAVDMVTSVKTIFGKTDDNRTGSEIIEPSLETDMTQTDGVTPLTGNPLTDTSATDSSVTGNQTESSADDFRIDEDVLNEINIRQEQYDDAYGLDGRA